MKSVKTSLWLLFVRAAAWTICGCFILCIGEFRTPTALAQVNPQFEPAVNLSNNPSRSRAPDVAAEGSSVYVAWFDQIGPSGIPEILFRRSIDEGKTFEGVVNLSDNAGGSLLPRVAAAGSEVYVVWEDDTGTLGVTDILFRRSLDQGETWDTTINLSNTPSKSSSSPAIAVTGPNVYVVWEEKVGGGGTSQEATVILFSRSTNQGKTFTAPVNISGNTVGDQFSPSIAATGSAVFVAWRNQPLPPDQPEVFFRRSLDEGVTWNPSPDLEAVNMSETTGASLNPTVSAVGSAVYVAWQDAIGTAGAPEILFRFSTDQGATFDTTLLNVSETPTRPSLAPASATAGSTFSFVWQEGIFGDILIRSASLLGPGAIDFSSRPIVNLFVTPTVSAIPRIARIGSMIFVVWQESSSSLDPPEIFLARMTPLNGVATTDLSFDPARPSITPNVSVDGFDTYVVWAEPGFALFNDIFFRSSPDGGRTFSDPLNLSNNPGSSRNPKVAVAGQAVYVLWEDDTETPGIHEIFFRRSLNRGVTWDPSLGMPPIKLSRFSGLTTGIARSPTLAATGSEVYVAWEADTPPDACPQIFARRSLNQGQSDPDSWEPLLSDPPSQRSCPGVTVCEKCKAFTPSLAAAGPNVYLTCKLYRLGEITIEVAISNKEEVPPVGGATAKNSTTIDDGLSIFEGDPKIAAVGSSIYVVWWKGNQIRFRSALADGLDLTFNPPLIGPPTLVSAGFIASRLPTVATAGSEVYVAWQDDGNNPGSPDIFFRKSEDGGKTFSFVKNLSANDGVSQNPWLAAAGPDVYITWQDDTGQPAFPQLLFRSSSDEGAIFPGAFILPVQADTSISSRRRLILRGHQKIDQRFANFGDRQRLSIVRGVFGFDGNFHDFRGTLIRFDLSGIPSDAEIVKAELFLLHSNEQREVISIHRMVKDWKELEASWFEPCQGCEPWWPGWSDSFPAAKNYVNQFTYTQTATTNPGWVSWDVTSDVRLFLSGTPNNGWFLKSFAQMGIDQTPVNFYSREFPNPDFRPHLKIHVR